MIGRALSAPLLAWHRRAVRGPRGPRVAAALAAVAGPRASSVLDVGAGDGDVGRRVAALLGAERLEALDVDPARGAAFDGARLPHADRSFDVVVLSDVLHHAEGAEVLLAECLRVAGRVVAIKEHVLRGATSRAVLWAMDQVGNAADRVPSPGRYLSPEALGAMVRRVGGRIERVAWPVHVHGGWIRRLAPSELQVALAVVRAPAVGP